MNDLIEVPAGHTGPLPERSAQKTRRADLLALGTWALLVATAAVWGLSLQSKDTQMKLWALPLAGHLHPLLGPGILPASAFAIAAIVYAPRLSRRIGWIPLLVLAFAAAATWAILLALGIGPAGLTRSILALSDVSHDLAAVGSPGPFLSHFVDRIGEYAVHTRAHPPGLLLLLWWSSRLGLRGPGWEAALEIIGGAAAIPAVLIAVRDLAGEDAARAAAPFVALAPAAVFVATSADALFMGVSAWAVALLVCATGRRGRMSWVLSLAGGTLAGAALFLSYGLVLVLGIPLAVAVGRRRAWPLAIAAVPIAVWGLVFASAGFWWPAGLEATRHQYLVGVAKNRPYWYFLVADVAAFAIALGPAVAVALARLRDRRLWLLVGAALAAVAIANLSGMSKGEVERIWLPFAPWVLVACSTLAPTDGEARRWLGLQIAAALALQIAVRSPW